MILTEKIVMKNSHKDYKLCHASKNLYNATLYDLKQHYLKTGKYKTYYTQRPDSLETITQTTVHYQPRLLYKPWIQSTADINHSSG